MRAQIVDRIRILGELQGARSHLLADERYYVEALSGLQVGSHRLHTHIELDAGH